MKVNFEELKKKFDDSKNIIRVEKNKQNPYVMVNKTCINDTNLSWSAKGLHTYLMSLPDDWTIYITELVTHTSSGRDHTYTVVNELLKFGYIEKIQYRYQGRIIGGAYTVFETPIDVSAHDNTKPRIVSIYVNDNGEIVEKSTVSPITEKPYTVEPDTVSTSLLSNKGTKVLKELNNNFGDDVDAATKLISLYKTFKIEKRVMPHTTKLLKANSHINLDVFEQIFIYLSEDSVKLKYKALQKVLANLNANNISTLKEFDEYNKKFSESKNSKNNSKSKGSSTPVAKTRFHNITETFTNYTPEELERMLLDQQWKHDVKKDITKEDIDNHNDNNFIAKDPQEKLYDICVKHDWKGVSVVTLKQGMEFAKKNGLDYPIFE